MILIGCLCFAANLFYLVLLVLVHTIFLQFSYQGNFAGHADLYNFLFCENTDIFRYSIFNQIYIIIP